MLSWRPVDQITLHNNIYQICIANLKKKYFIYLFLEKAKGKEKEERRKNYQCVVASHAPPTGDLARHLGMCPDWESNQGPLGSQASTQSTEPHQLGFVLLIL